MLNTFISGFCDVRHRRIPVQGCTKLSLGDQGDNDEVYECGNYHWSTNVASAASVCSPNNGNRNNPQ